MPKPLRDDKDKEITLSDDDAQLYRRWLSDAFQKADTYLGTEVEDFLDPLMRMERMIAERHAGSSSPTLERGFASAVGHTNPENAAIDDILGYAGASFKKRFHQASNTLEGMLALLEQAGAAVTRGGSDFIITKPRALSPAGLNPKHYEGPVIQPRLSWLVEGLRSISIYPEDLSIHLRDADAGKMKAAPHLLIEIPRLKKQIMLNQQKGEVTFVAQERFELNMWERLTKYQLKNVPGIAPVILREKDRWLDRILVLLQSGEAKLGIKVNVRKDADDPLRNPMSYSVQLIEESLRTTYDATGEYPVQASGTITHGPLADGKRTWVSVDSAIRDLWKKKKMFQSRNGLTRETCPYTSLHDMKTKLGMIKNYTIAQIEESLRATCDATGEYPIKTHGIIKYGPLANGKRTWLSVDASMTSIWQNKKQIKSVNGLMRENCPYTSLDDMKTKLGMTNDYTIAQVEESLRATYAIAGEYPLQHLGIIEYGPLANGKRTWMSVDASMKMIWRGLNPRKSVNGLTRENCPYTSLRDMKIKRGLTNDYTIAQVEESLRATYDVTGEYPTQASGIITHGPLANNRRTWTSVDHSISGIWGDKSRSQSSNGLTRENCPYTSLGDMKTKLELINGYTIAQIEESLRATYDATGEYPAQASGIITHGPLADNTRKWHTVDQSMSAIWQEENPAQSRNGLTRKNCPYKSLHDMKTKLELTNDYTISQIEESLRATYDAVGQYPIADSGIITHGPLADNKRTWLSVDLSMRVLWRDKNPYPSINGLTRENCPYKSLTMMRKELGMVRNKASSLLGSHSPAMPQP